MHIRNTFRTFTTEINQAKNRLEVEKDVEKILADNPEQAEVIWIIEQRLTDNAEFSYGDVKGLNFYNNFIPGQKAIFILGERNYKEFDEWRSAKKSLMEFCEKNKQCAWVHYEDRRVDESSFIYFLKVFEQRINEM